MEIDEAQEDFENEHRLAQAALRRKCVPLEPGKVMRYESTYDESGGPTCCDKVWIDRLTGAEVTRYDAADPANTNSYYGARPDEEIFAARGLDYYEQIDATRAKPMPRFIPYDDGLWDEDDEHDCGEDTCVSTFVQDARRPQEPCACSTSSGRRRVLRIAGDSSST